MRSIQVIEGNSNTAGDLKLNNSMNISIKPLLKHQNTSLYPLDYVILCGEKVFEGNTKIYQEMTETIKGFKSTVGRFKL